MIQLPQILKQPLRDVGRKIGFYPLPGTVQSGMVKILKALRINCVLDVGGHYGEFRQLTRNVGFAGRIVSFEPVSASFSILTARAAHDKNWSGYQLALSDHEGSAEINLYHDSSFNSLLAPSKYRGGADQQFKEQMKLMGRETVTLRRLDSIFSEVTNGIQTSRIYLKMDTQGHDLSVMRGAEKVLHHVYAIQTEMAARKLYMGMPDMLEALSNFDALGFAPFAFVPVTIESNEVTVIEWDCLLTRKP